MMYLHNWDQARWLCIKQTQLQNENISHCKYKHVTGQTAWQQLYMHHLVLTDLIELEKYLINQKYFSIAMGETLQIIWMPKELSVRIPSEVSSDN